MKIYKYLYYRFYEWLLKTWGSQDIPQWSALLQVSFLMFVNLATIVLLSDILGITNIFNNSISNNEIFVVGNIILIINYFWLMYNGKYKRIAEEYKDEPKNKRLRNALLLWLFVIMSFVVPYFLAVFYKKLIGLG